MYSNGCGRSDKIQIMRPEKVLQGLILKINKQVIAELRSE